MKVSALDESGKPVDWWFIYKVPQLSSGSGTSDKATGYEYIYYDSAIDRNSEPRQRNVIRSPYRPIPPLMDSDGIHKTFDIKYINLGPMGLHWAWPETCDHAKWGITLHNPWVCVGDINRMISQRKRGGGTIAFQNQILWLGLWPRW